MRQISLLLFTLLAFISFSQNDSSNIAKEDSVLFHSFEKDTLNYLSSNCESIEITFYESGKSIAFSSQKHCKLFFTFIDSIPNPSFSKHSKAYMMFIVNGDLFTEAELYYTDDSQYLIFKRNKKEYYNKLTKAGVSFFSQFM